MFCRRLCWAILAATLVSVAAVGMLEGQAENPAQSWSLYAAVLEKIPLFFVMFAAVWARSRFATQATEPFQGSHLKLRH